MQMRQAVCVHCTALYGNTYSLPTKRIRVTNFTKSELTRKYRYRLNLVQQFLLKWKRIYLMDLKPVHHTESSKNIQVTNGAVVQIKEDN